MIWETVFTFAVVSALILYFMLQDKYQYWKKRRVPGPKPTIFLGNIGETLKMRKFMGEVITDIYRSYPDLPFVGVFISGKPALLVRDPDFVRNITVKDFNHFVDNDGFVDKKLDPILGRHPFFLKGDEWKQVRSQLTPCFTASKMRNIFTLIDDNCKKFLNYIEAQDNAFNGHGVEAKGLCLRYTLQNVSSIAFGVDGNCFDDPNNEFIYLAKNILHTDTLQAYKSILAKIFPSLLPLLSIKIISKDVEDRLQEIITDTLSFRERHKVERNDFLSVLANLKKTANYTDLEVTAHATGFFGDGYETSSILLSFILYELASNSDVQNKLREELNDVFSESLTCEDVQKLTYLDAVVSETLRKDPPVFTLTKTCTKPYTYRPSNQSFRNLSVCLEENTTILIPVYAFQHDPKYFSEPEQFIPERFLDANKTELFKYTFLPFGEGPRMCLGQKFGILQIKAAVAYIVKHFLLTPNNKTRLPLQLNPAYPMMAPIGGLWINFERI